MLLLASRYVYGSLQRADDGGGGVRRGGGRGGRLERARPRQLQIAAPPPWPPPIRTRQCTAGAGRRRRRSCGGTRTHTLHGRCGGKGAGGPRGARWTPLQLPCRRSPTRRTLIALSQRGRERGQRQRQGDGSELHGAPASVVQRAPCAMLDCETRGRSGGPLTVPARRLRSRHFFARGERTRGARQGWWMASKRGGECASGGGAAGSAHVLASADQTVPRPCGAPAPAGWVAAGAAVETQCTSCRATPLQRHPNTSARPAAAPVNHTAPQLPTHASKRGCRPGGGCTCPPRCACRAEQLTRIASRYRATEQHAAASQPAAHRRKAACAAIARLPREDARLLHNRHHTPSNWGHDRKLAPPVSPRAVGWR